MSEEINLSKLRGTHLYNCFRSMKQRCYYEKGQKYSYYGGRGIIICNEWLNDRTLFFKWSFENGYADGLSIDRIDTDGNYEPSNCRWVSKEFQQQNRRVRKDNLSGYAGVSFSKIHNKWRADINADKKRTHLGLFSNRHDAAEAYNKFIINNNLFHMLNDIRR